MTPRGQSWFMCNRLDKPAKCLTGEWEVIVSFTSVFRMCWHGWDSDLRLPPTVSQDAVLLCFLRCSRWARRTVEKRSPLTGQQASQALPLVLWDASLDLASPADGSSMDVSWGGWLSTQWGRGWGAARTGRCENMGRKQVSSNVQKPRQQAPE